MMLGPIWIKVALSWPIDWKQVRNGRRRDIAGKQVADRVNRMA